MAECGCRFCTMQKRVDAAWEKMPIEVQAIVEELMLGWETEAMEAGYWKARHRNEWPDHGEGQDVPPGVMMPLSETGG
jgi:hypothetical protein